MASRDTLARSPLTPAERAELTQGIADIACNLLAKGAQTQVARALRPDLHDAHALADAGRALAAVARDVLVGLADLRARTGPEIDALLDALEAAHAAHERALDRTEAANAAAARIGGMLQ